MICTITGFTDTFFECGEKAQSSGKRERSFLVDSLFLNPLISQNWIGTVHFG